MELNIHVKARGAEISAGPVVIRSVDDLDKTARRLAGIIKAWLRQVPLTRGGARAVFDLSAEWEEDVQKIYPQEEVTLHPSGKVTRKVLARAARSKGRRHGRNKAHS